MTVGLDELRLAAALATAIDGVDVEVRGTGRRWFVSERMPGSPIDVAGFRQLVLATVRGGRLGLLPASRLWVSGALCTLGGGVFRHRDDGL